MMFEKFNKVVIALVGEQNADIWWHSPNKAFGDKHPIDVLAEDHTKISDYLYSHLNGDYS